MAAAPEEPPPATPDLSARQIFLNAAPSGIDARWAWTQAGGRGRDIRIIDVEGAWRFTHEDLTQNQGGVVAGTPIAGVDWRNHGTAVLGEFSGDVNTVGIVGISAEAIVSAFSHGSIGSAAAINQAASRLRAGDIILLEMHRPGPRFNFATRTDQRGYIAVEWWPDDFAAILNATSRGIIVVEAAGNGAENLDDALYQTPGTGFPAGWRNSFRRTNRDSGAIVVGAGAPPPGTHGRDQRPDRSRLDFSNWGALIDAQGWGREVTTLRLRRSAGRHERGSLVHRHLQRHVERVADRHRRDRLHPGHGQGQGTPRADSGASAQLPPLDRLATAGCAGPPGDAAHRQPSRYPRLCNLRLRQGQGARQGSGQGSGKEVVKEGQGNARRKSARNSSRNKEIARTRTPRSQGHQGVQGRQGHQGSSRKARNSRRRTRTRTSWRASSARCHRHQASPDADRRDGGDAAAARRPRAGGAAARALHRRGVAARSRASRRCREAARRRRTRRI